MARKDDTLMLLALLVGALAFLRRKVEWGTGWMWPVPSFQAKDGTLYEAVISDGIGTPRPHGVHRGVDIMFRRRSRTDRPEYPDKSASGSPMHFAPPGIPVVAARDGTIWSAGKTPRGWSVVINHGRPFATYYTHLVALAVAPHADGKSVGTGKVTHIRAGDVIGLMGADPMDASKLRHLHFSVAHDGPPESAAVDPADAMRTWSRPPTVFKV
jgi:hypothetical protein